MEKLLASVHSVLIDQQMFFSVVIHPMTCLCQTHENFISLANALLPPYNRQWIEQNAVCSFTETCMLNQCEACKDGTLLKGVLQSNEETHEDDVELYQWQKDGPEARLKKVKLILSYDDAVTSLIDSLPDFLKHVFVKRTQEVAYRRDIQESSEYVCVVQIDFAENYTCVFQDEVQSAHWNQTQLSIFTACLWKGVTHMTSFAVVSDNLMHDKSTALAYLYEVLQASDLYGIKQLKIWSDGPSSQFKNRFIAHYLPIISAVYNCQCSWNYFATSHGKGPVDGVGGAIKRAVRDMVTSRRVVVTDVDSFVQAYQLSGGSIKVIICNQPSSCLLPRDDCPVTSGIRTSHHIECLNGKLELSTYSMFGNDGSVGPLVTTATTPEDAKICQGDFVIVRVHGEKSSTEKKFLAIVTTSVGDYITVMYLRRNGKRFSVDDKEEWSVDRNDILRVVEQPVLDNRGRYDFGEINI